MVVAILPGHSSDGTAPRLPLVSLALGGVVVDLALAEQVADLAHCHHHLHWQQHHHRLQCQQDLRVLVALLVSLGVCNRLLDLGSLSGSNNNYHHHRHPLDLAPLLPQPQSQALVLPPLPLLM